MHIFCDNFCDNSEEEEMNDASETTKLILSDIERECVQVRSETYWTSSDVKLRLRKIISLVKKLEFFHSNMSSLRACGEDFEDALSFLEERIGDNLKAFDDHSEEWRTFCARLKRRRNWKLKKGRQKKKEKERRRKHALRVNRKVLEESIDNWRRRRLQMGNSTNMGSEENPLSSSDDRSIQRRLKLVFLLMHLRGVREAKHLDKL